MKASGIQHVDLSESAALMGEEMPSPAAATLVQFLQLPKQCLSLRFEEAGPCAGNMNMRRDDTLLDEIRNNNTPILLVRTYQWSQPTLSFGKHQPDKDRHPETVTQLLAQMGHPAATIETVTRPTGGRAILHGEDISFAFITNAPVFLKLSLKDSYCVFTYWLKETLRALDIPISDHCAATSKEYLRSALCFETKTPSDILGIDGQKLAGCAQARRAGGILQHGSAFLPNATARYADFSTALFKIVEKSCTQS